MEFDKPTFVGEINERGFALIRGALLPEEMESWHAKLDAVLHASNAAIRSRKGVVYAARNIITELPESNTLWQRDDVRNHIVAMLGEDFVLVRALYFDKHPERTWSLPWHKDMTIAVKDNQLPSETLSKPTTKQGVPHVEASTQILDNMLTLRVHLDEVTEENGPLDVIPGSHKSGKQSAAIDVHPEPVLAKAGDILAMRPLLSHASGMSTEGTERHRRILHFEFSADRQLPDGYQWYYV